MSSSESSGSTRGDAADSEILETDNDSVSASSSSVTSLCVDENSESEHQLSGTILNEENTARGEIPSLLSQPLSCHTCPICLSKNQVFHADTTTSKCKSEETAVEEDADDLPLIKSVELEKKEPTIKNDAAGDGVDEDEPLREVPEAEQNSSLPSPSSPIKQKHMYQNQHGVPIFQVTSCGHSFCSPCLYAYIRSKLMEGTLQIPCCHFIMPDEAEDFHVCDVDIPESDILQLIEKETYDQASLFAAGYWSIGNCCSAEIINMKEKIEKIKFDNFHGKDSVRRCPKCDEPQLFDVEMMKSFDADLKARSQSVQTAESGRIAATRSSNVENRTRLGRILHTIRRRNILNVVDESGAHGSLSSSRGAGSIRNKTETPASTDGIGIDEEMQAETEQILSKSTTPIVKCQSCHTEFCYFHSNAHTGQTCEQYNEKTAELDRVNVEYANQTLHSKQCPTCGILVSKEGGCNQIKCGNCGTHFCWLCRAKVDDGAFPEHFRWWNLNGCPNMQLDGSDEPMRCTVRMAKAMSIAQLIVLGIPSIALAIASSLLCPCLVPGVGRTNRERAVNCVSFWGSFLSSIIMFPFSCMGMIILALMYCFTGMLVLIIKCCGVMTRRLHRSIPNEAASDGAPIVGGSLPNDDIPTDLLIELERIFERIEEGALEESNEH